MNEDQAGELLEFVEEIKGKVYWIESYTDDNKKTLRGIKDLLEAQNELLKDAVQALQQIARNQ